MPVTGAMMCIMGRRMLRQINVERHELVKVTERMVAVNGHQITLDGAVLLDLTAGGRKSVQMVYISPDVKNIVLSQTACKELGLVGKELSIVTVPAEAAEPSTYRPGASPAELKEIIGEHCQKMLATTIKTTMDAMPRSPAETSRGD